MRNEQERWETMLSRVKERGGRIRRRRQWAAATTAALALMLVVTVQFGLTRPAPEPQSFALNEVEMEVVLLEHDIVMDEMGLY
ncbi:MAG TPA: hypothetical protein PKH10_09005 [bacterium]|nr:hypothetical protein [bacterium]